MLINLSQTVLLVASLFVIGECSTSDHNETIVKESLNGASHSTTIEPGSASNSSHPPALELKLATITTTEAPQIIVEISHVTTGKPAVELSATETPLIKTKHVLAEQETSEAPHEDLGSVPKFCEYLKPICSGLDEISPKLLFRFQSQFKQLVQLTNGKLGMCFLEHYDFDPTLKTLTKADLTKICNSKNVSPNLKGSIKKFEACAAENWDPAVDKELSRIIDARLNCIKFHDHTGKVDTNSSLIDHDNEDMTLINEVVSKVLDDEKNSHSANSSEINILDMSTKTNSSSGHQQSHSILSSEAKGLLNDPNTVVVFVDDSSSSSSSSSSNSKTTAESLISVQKITAPAEPQHNSTSKLMSILNSTTTAQPSLEKSIKDNLEHLEEASANHIDTHESSSNVTKMTERPTELLVVQDKTTALPHVSVTEVTLSNLLKESSNILPFDHTSLNGSYEESLTSTVKPLIVTKVDTKTATTTNAPIVIKKTEIVVKTTLAPSSIKLQTPVGSQVKPKEAPTVKSTEQTLETLEEILKRQEKEKMEFENKLRLEREGLMKLLQKSKDENVVLNAMKSLQLQRDASTNHATDNKLHQLEHERQMAIDPIGHTIKHQQYEISKQQRLAGAKA